jgi:hypothetical protein
MQGVPLYAGVGQRAPSDELRSIIYLFMTFLVMKPDRPVLKSVSRTFFVVERFSWNIFV